MAVRHPVQTNCLTLQNGQTVFVVFTIAAFCGSLL
jgi:hypothetical protein